MSVNLSSGVNSIFDHYRGVAGIDGAMHCFNDAGEEVDPNSLDFKGSISMTKDARQVGYLHWIIYLVQRVQAFLSGTKFVDPTCCHGAIVLGWDVRKSGHLIFAHGLLPGLVTTSEHPLDGASQIDFYRPKDERLRKIMAEHAQMSAYMPPKHRLKGLKVEKAPFSMERMIKAAFYQQSLGVSEKNQRRLSFALADFIRGEQPLNRLGKPKSYYCATYALMVLQTSLLENKLSDQERVLLRSKDRKTLSNYFFTRLSNPKDRLGEIFQNSMLCQLDGRTTISSYLSWVLNHS